MDNRDNWYLWSVGLLVLTILITFYSVLYAFYGTYSWGSFIAISFAYIISICGALLSAICGLVSYLKKGRKTKSLIIIVICIVVAIIPPAYKEYYFKERDKQNQKAYKAKLETLTPTQHLFKLVKNLRNEENRVKFIKHLENGANINASEGGALLIMHVSSQHGDKGGLDTLEFLVKRGADVNLKSDFHGTTALHIHASGNDIAIVKKLLELGADAKAINKDGETVLHSVARGRDNLEIAKLLIEQGIDIDALDKKGRTALHTAVRWHRFQLIEELLNHGANPMIKTTETETALDMAKSFAQGISDLYMRKSYKNVVKLMDSYNENKSLEKIEK